MDRLRFPLMLGVALAAGAMSAHAQSAPGMPGVQAPAPAKIEDIQVAQDGTTVSILVKFSGQPSAASARADGKDLRLDIDGIAIAPLSLMPPQGSLIARVTAAKGEVVLSGAALGNPDVVIYRHAVLVKAQLADPAAIGGASLMTGQIAPTPIAIAPPPPQPLPQIAAPPMPAPVAPSPEAPAPVVAVAPPPAPAPAPTPDVTPASAPAPTHAASLAGIDAARCAAASDELAKDSWALGAMGDVALCLIDQGKQDEARVKLDQLGAITPQDWRVSLGRAVLASDAGETADANALFLAASLGAPNDELRQAITARIKTEAAAPVAAAPQPQALAPEPIEPDNELQLPLPK
jgi:hypothetical protein